jgi:hypothetical protein
MKEAKMDTNTERAENQRLAEVLGREAIANIHYEDASVAPNAAYCVARIAAHYASLVIGESR